MQSSNATYLLVLITVLPCSCGQHAATADPPAQVPVPAPVPEAFEQKGVLGNELKSRGYDENAVDKLFAEVLEKDTALAGLLGRWAGRAPEHAKHLEAFNGFNGNNADYYVDAEQRVSVLADTTLQRGMIGRLQASRERYEEVVGPYRRNIDQHRSVMEQGNDIITLIGLERTLDVVETYQRENLPDRKILDTDLAALIMLRDELRQKLKP